MSRARTWRSNTAGPRHQLDRLPALAAELVRRQVAVIVAVGGPPAAFAAKAATTTIPIVFTVSDDPVRLGLVASLARPGGNVTGINFFSDEVRGKAAGTPARAGAHSHSCGRARQSGQYCEYRDHIERRGTGCARHRAANPGRSTPAPATRSMRPSQPLCASGPTPSSVGSRPFFTSRRVQLVQLAARHAIPATYPGREYVEVGGLMSYGANIARCVASGRRLCRPHPQGRKARGPAGRAGVASSSWSSTTRPPGCSASPCRRLCSRRADEVIE